MNLVEISYNGEDPFPWEDNLVAFTGKILNYLDRHNWEVSIVFTDDPFIKNLNSKYRGKDEATDVLSFCQEEEDGKDVFYAGDIIISMESVRKNALYFKTDPEEELKRVVIHGILHLSGMEHESNDPGEPMLKKQETILKALEGEKLF